MVVFRGLCGLFDVTSTSLPASDRGGMDTGGQVHTNKLDGVAAVVTDPRSASNTTPVNQSAFDTFWPE